MFTYWHYSGVGHTWFYYRRTTKTISQFLVDGVWKKSNYAPDQVPLLGYKELTQMFTYYYSPVSNRVRRFSKDVSQYLSYRGEWCPSSWAALDMANTNFIKLK